MPAQLRREALREVRARQAQVAVDELAGAAARRHPAAGLFRHVLLRRRVGWYELTLSLRNVDILCRLLGCVRTCRAVPEAR